jgi:hypothetical protein
MRTALINLVHATVPAALVVGGLFFGPTAVANEITQFDLSLANLLKHDRDVPLAADPLVECRGRQVVIAIYQNPQAGLRDLKIDAVLLSRTLALHQPSGGNLFDSTVFHFYSTRDQAHFTEVKVDLKDLKRFALGRLSREALLARVELKQCAGEDLKATYGNMSYSQIVGNSQVVSGIYMSERKDMLAHILSLKANGYDVRVAERQFLKMEDTVRNRDKVGFDLAYHQLENSIAAVPEAGAKVRLASEDSWQR